MVFLGALATCQPAPPERTPPASTTNSVEAAPKVPEPVPENWDRDVLSTRLEVDLETTSARATIRLAEASAPGASLEAGGLTIDRVEVDGVPTRFTAQDGALHVAAPATATELAVDYGFAAQPRLEGFKDGLTLTWPYHCGNLFPCDSRPDDGLTFELSVRAPEGQQVVYPARIEADAPSYMLAWAAGPYEEHEIGTTPRGRRVSIWAKPEQLATTRAATRRLPELFDWLETTYGDYAYGDHVGSVVVDWGPGGLGGMEHHPYWHVSAADAGDVSVHVHEAAHGWYGNGVRIECWEDFVLSEGTVTYMATRAIEQVLGPEAGRARWEAHQRRLEALQAGSRSKIAWPRGCNELDILDDGLFGPAPYVKGAMFYRAVADQIGAEELDAVLHDFYLAHRGRAARFDDVLAAIRTASGLDAGPCAIAWLRGEAIPGADACVRPPK